MTENTENANDGSVQEIAVIHRNPTGILRGSQPAIEANINRDVQVQGVPADQQPEIAASLLTDKQEASAVPAKIQTGMVAVARLRPYAKNSEIYREYDDPLFVENVGRNGVLTDLVVTADGEVLGGNRRLRAAKLVGLLAVPVRVVACATEDEKSIRVLDDNLYRVKTNQETVREYIVRKAVEERAANRRKAEAGKKHGKLAEEVETVTPLPGKTGKARDLASEGSGRSGVSLERGCKVIEAADALRKGGDAKTADELLGKLDSDGYTPAYNYAKSLGLVGKPTGTIKGGTKPNGNDAPEQAEGKNQTPQPVAPHTNAVLVPSLPQPHGRPFNVTLPLGNDGGLPAVDGSGDESAPLELPDGKSSFERCIFYFQKGLDEYGYVEIEELHVGEKETLLHTLKEVVECYRDCRDDLQ